jgi:hypothetical protein
MKRKARSSLYRKAARCRHPWCSDCRTRRGRNRGNRRDRREARAALR